MRETRKAKSRTSKMTGISETDMMTPDTFAGMLRMQLKIQPELLRILKLPPWLKFLLPYEREDQENLTATDRDRFICAYDTINQNGVLGQLVDIHGVWSHYPHTTQRFLPWHRIYMMKLEEALQTSHPDVTIPYWDWTKKSEQGIPTWLQNFEPTVVTPTKTISVTRGSNTAASLATTVSNIPSIMALNDFTNFTSQLQFVHNGVHVWVGGSMSQVPTAPADPIFWMHHANIDRIWWQWQTSPQGQGKNPILSLTGVGPSSAIMDPWANTEQDTRDIASLGYTYVLD